MTITNEKRLNEMLDIHVNKKKRIKKKIIKLYSGLAELKILLWTDTEVCEILGMHRSRIHHIKTHPKKLKEKTIDELYLNITTVLNKLR